MNKPKLAWLVALTAGLLLVIAACGTADPTPAPTSAPPDIAPTPDPSAPEASVAGRYRLKPPEYEEDYDQELVEDYYLVLNEDGSAQFEAETIADGSTSVIARGTWQLDGNGAIIEITELDGKPASEPVVIRYEYRDGFPVATDYEAGGALHNLEETEFTIGAGERHPLVYKLHQQLAAIDYLGFTDPGDDLYTEETRKAVVAFQESQGLYPDGEVDPATWALLGNPRPPLPTPTPLPTPPEATGQASVPDLDNLPTHTDDGKPILYLTFDDGPSNFSEQALDLMDKYDAQATFFVLGKAAEANPGIIRAQAQGGHYIANHTYGHPSLPDVSREDFVKEVDGTKEIILDIAGDLFTLDKDVRYLRPPYGATDANTRQYAADLGYAVVLWDVDPQDWRRPGAKIIADHIINSAYPGAIILMHDGGGDRSQTIAALDTVFRELGTQGYAFRNIYVP